MGRVRFCAGCARKRVPTEILADGALEGSMRQLLKF
jgi:hypothetical protein